MTNSKIFIIVILQDTDIDKRMWAWWRDAGVAAQTILLSATEQGLGGLMIGIETVKSAKEVLDICRENGVLCLTAKDKVRLLPALNIPEDTLKKAIDAYYEQYGC